MSTLFRKYVALIILLLVVIGIAIFVWFLSSQQFEKNLELAVIKSVVQYEHTSLQGTIIIRMQPKAAGPDDSWGDTSSYMSIWKYEKGIFKPATQIDVEHVDENAYVFMFMIQKIEGNKAFVDVATFYPNGGGHGSHELFEYRGQDWYEENTIGYEDWDVFPTDTPGALPVPADTPTVFP